MAAGIIPLNNKFHVCVFFDGCYRHYSFMRTRDARSLIADWLKEHGVPEAVLAISDEEVDPIADSLEDRGLDLYGLPLRRAWTSPPQPVSACGPVRSRWSLSVPSSFPPGSDTSFPCPPPAPLTHTTATRSTSHSESHPQLAHAGASTPVTCATSPASGRGPLLVSATGSLPVSAGA